MHDSFSFCAIFPYGRWITIKNIAQNERVCADEDEMTVYVGKGQ